MTDTFFASDLHLGHRNICKYRNRFSTTEEHDEYIVDKILSKSNKRNHIWLLGDCFFTKESLEYLKLFSDRFSSVNWILGNHDTDNEFRMSNVFEAVNKGYIKRIGSLFKYKEFWLSHAPIHTDELRGKRNIHGHTHFHNIDDNRYFNTSVENIDYTPISIREIRWRIQEMVNLEEQKRGS